MFLNLNLKAEFVVLMILSASINHDLLSASLSVICQLGHSVEDMIGANYAGNYVLTYRIHGIANDYNYVQLASNTFGCEQLPFLTIPNLSKVFVLT